MEIPSGTSHFYLRPQRISSKHEFCGKGVICTQNISKLTRLARTTGENQVKEEKTEASSKEGDCKCRSQRGKTDKRQT